ncbi:PREDICTED: peptidyl-prolyl cis-trans isomerase G-like [Diuraphis noxia]|uniref:peptidyl-prolyl cis-trans isomerase G-like n=1 Tax=Diuraphis noxia TaxID=143948 RepID=UPI0007637F64|nr:PREDICTED: peptidyl-prolyl cis-trans isomerase G-like [Diuraphis noxia]
MQSRLLSKASWEDMHRQHRKNIRDAKSKVDNKSPSLKITAYYKPGVIEGNAAKLTQIEEDNFKLVTNINTIYRTQGKTNCHRLKLSNSRIKVQNNEIDIIKLNQTKFKENVALLDRIVQVKPQVDFNYMEEHYKKHIQLIMLMSKFPESYKKKKYHDPLILNTEIPKGIRIKKSKCYLDINDLTENRWLGRMTIEVYDSIVPKTTGNFKMLCQQRSDGLDYSGTQIFRIVPGLFCLAGDVEYSIGLGGLSATKGERYFNDENYLLSHNAPGTLSMYNFEKNENASQFMITFKPLTVLNGRHVVFGKVIGGMRTLRFIEDLGFVTGKPKHKIVISKCGTFDNYFKVSRARLTQKAVPSQNLLNLSIKSKSSLKRKSPKKTFLSPSADELEYDINMPSIHRLFI